jgi:hypothetical protein
LHLRRARRAFKREARLRKEIEAFKAAQQRATSARTAQERGEAIQAQWETATIGSGAKASGLSQRRYREVRDLVNRVLATLDSKARSTARYRLIWSEPTLQRRRGASGEAFVELPPETAMALRARMDPLVPLWSEYKKRVAVAG